MRKMKKRIAGLMAVCMMATSLMPTVTYAMEEPTSDVTLSASEATSAESEVGGSGQDAGSDSMVNDPEMDSASSSEMTSESNANQEENPTSEVASEPTETPEPSSSEAVVEEPVASEATDQEEEPENTPNPDSVGEFTAFAIKDPENGDTTEANIGDEVTLTAEGTRDDVEVQYQWQVMRKPESNTIEYSLYDYENDESTWYNFPLDDSTEAELLEENPEATWSGIETYYAITEALEDIGEDSSTVSVAWKTCNFALDGYEIRAEKVDDHVEVYADKDNERYTAVLNSDGQWEFTDDSAEAQEVQYTWQDIEGANEPQYTLEVTEEDFSSTYRCKVTIVDESYLAECKEVLLQQGIELTEEQLNAEQILYTIAMYIHSDEWDQYLEEQQRNSGENLVATFALDASDHPKLSSDTQWIEGLNNTYEYLTKETYARVTEWLNAGKITQQEADRYWTRLGNGFSQYATANVLNNEGLPTGVTRIYNGTDLTNGAMEVLSEWYGKTVQLTAGGFAGELAEKMNQTSAQLQKRNEQLARRDDARTQWIAGVSHDVRTSLALILGWAEQLEQDARLPENARKKAGKICSQSEKILNLIEDLNLTSKLEYGTQPLRRQKFAAGPLMRELVAQLCESPQAENCELSLHQTEAAERANLFVDRALLERLLENLFSNSIRHNLPPVKIGIRTEVRENSFCLTVKDNGTGYPAAVLQALHGAPQNEQTPHILGLHVVEQIAAAHGGKAVFEQNTPKGARVTVWLPLRE